MGFRFMLSVLAVIGAVACAGCVSTAGLSDRALAFNSVEADAADSQLLLNVLRAAHRNPTHYSTLQTIRESRSLEGSGTLAGSFPFGRDANNLFGFNPQLTASGNLNPSFDVVPLSTRVAALGLYSPVSPDDFVLYWNQGWPRAVVLTMFVDEVVLNDAAVEFCDLGQFAIPRNIQDLRYIDNSAYRIATFENAQHLFDCLSDHLYISEDDSPLVVATGVKGSDMLSNLPGLAEKGFSVRQHGTAATSSYSIGKAKPDWKFSLLKKGRRGVAELSKSVGDTSLSNSSQPEISMTLRSVDGMVFYLGEILRLRNEQNYSATVKIDDKRQRLFSVEVGAPRPGDAITASFANRTYEINRIGREGDATLTTLSLLTQIFALHREDNDLPRTTAVQIVGRP